jgi:hypothetical protein
MSGLAATRFDRIESSCDAPWIDVQRALDRSGADGSKALQCARFDPAAFGRNRPIAETPADSLVVARLARKAAFRRFAARGREPSGDMKSKFLDLTRRCGSVRQSTNNHSNAGYVDDVPSKEEAECQKVF